MRVWLITVGEPLPIDADGQRLLRCGLLAEVLAGRGHEVVWWSSEFDHALKRHRFDRDTTVTIAPGYALRLLHAQGYRRNVSLARIRNHRSLGRAFARASAADAQQPDVIMASFPTIELALEAARYGRARNIPVVVDVRDLWPDVFLDLVPALARPLLRLLLHRLYAETRVALRGATAVTGVSPGYVAWGLRYAGRAAGPDDRDFPLGYPADRPDEAALQAAEARWDALLGPREAAPFVCSFFGVIGPHVALETVIEAARRLDGAGTPFRFIICGSGDHLARYQALAEGCGNVCFPGWVNRAEIWALMRRSAAGLAPYSDVENFRMGLPNKPIEYLSAGLPVLASVEGTLGDLICGHGCGLVYRNGDPEGLVAALRGLHDEPARRERMAAAAAALFEQRFRAERVYAQLADYLEALARRAPPAQEA